jgi:hypothetical protein
MSLITLADAMERTRTLTRTFLVMIAITAGIVAGLLAMHSLNTHATSTGHPDTVTTAAAGSHHAHDAAPVGEAAAGECGDCAGGHDTMMWMACVLALLATVLILARISRSWQTPDPERGSPTVLLWPARRAPVHPPSLHVLCISRT